MRIHKLKSDNAVIIVNGEEGLKKNFTNNRVIKQRNNRSYKSYRTYSPIVL